jgi:hypothetical protein
MYSGTWESNLGSNGAQDRTRFQGFFGAHDWSALEPDRNDTVLTGGQGSGSRAFNPPASDDWVLVLESVP